VKELDTIKEIIGVLPDMPMIMLHTMDSKPDRMVGLFSYDASLQQTFGDASGYGDTIETPRIQIRVRDLTDPEAEKLIRAIEEKLSAYDDGSALFVWVSGILPLGRDGHNPPRWEYTVNYEVALSD